MKKIVAATLVAFSLFASTQASFANSFRKHGAGTQGASTQSNPGVQGLALGSFFTDCEFFETPGKASASLQTIVVDNHNQATVQLKASGGGAAYSYLENPLSTLTIIKTPITFNLVKGNGNFLGVEAIFIPHGSTTESFIDFATPDSKLGNFFSSVVPMTSNGNGGFALPLGDGTNGLPQGGQLTGLFFVEFGNPNNCDNKNSNVNHLMINNRPIAIDATAEAAFCDDGCGEK
ncbi:hypothetical protein BH10CYA1_BH10CYA1_50750 [soil metagenome]